LRRKRKQNDGVFQDFHIFATWDVRLSWIAYSLGGGLAYYGNAVRALYWYTVFRRVICGYARGDIYDHPKDRPEKK